MAAAHIKGILSDWGFAENEIFTDCPNSELRRIFQHVLLGVFQAI